jgi:hypothetical protein
VIRKLEIYARAPDLTRRGPLPWETATVTLDHLGVCAWDLTMDARVAHRTGPGWGVFITLDREVILSGSVEDPEREKDSATSPGTIRVSGAGDLAVVAGALAWPSPEAPLTLQSTRANTRSGPAETVIKGFVSANIGVNRAATRRDPAAPLARQVVVAPDLGRGSTVEYSARFTPLMEVIRACHGGLGVAVTQQGEDLVFEVHPTVTRPSAVFSHHLGNLRAVRWRDAAPEVTHAIVGGEGTGVGRNLRVRSDSAAANAWRVASEEFIDQRSETSAAALNAAGDQAVADGRRTGIIAATLVDTPRLRYGQHYGLGDRVTIMPEPGSAYTDQVTSVTIDADRRAGTLTITPAVGWATGGLYQTRRDREIALLRRAVSALERSV